MESTERFSIYTSIVCILSHIFKTTIRETTFMGRVKKWKGKYEVPSRNHSRTFR